MSAEVQISHRDFVQSLLKAARERGIPLIAIYSGQEGDKLYTRVSSNVGQEVSADMLSYIRGQRDVEAGAKALHALKRDNVCAICNNAGHGMDSTREYADLSKAAQRDHVAAVEAVLAGALPLS